MQLGEDKWEEKDEGGNGQREVQGDVAKAPLSRDLRK